MFLILELMRFHLKTGKMKKRIDFFIEVRGSLKLSQFWDKITGIIKNQKQKPKCVAVSATTYSKLLDGRKN